MKIKIQKTAEKDRLILVDSKKLMLHTSEEDLSYRNSAIVEDAYHKDWFYPVAKFIYFIPPAASIRDGEMILPRFSGHLDKPQVKRRRGESVHEKETQKI
jgi:hypothetical protein